jgi:hypothetical protein
LRDFWQKSVLRTAMFTPKDASEVAGSVSAMIRINGGDGINHLPHPRKTRHNAFYSA